MPFEAQFQGFRRYSLPLIYKVVRGRDGLGLGDIKLIAAAGVWLPVNGSFYAIAAASIFALAGTVAIGLWRRQAAVLVELTAVCGFSCASFLAFMALGRSAASSAFELKAIQTAHANTMLPTAHLSARWSLNGGL